jgi:hypothetical protein
MGVYHLVPAETEETKVSSSSASSSSSSSSSALPPTSVSGSSAMDMDASALNSKRFRLEIPYVLFVLLNKLLKSPIVTPEVLDPFEQAWDQSEKLSIASLQLRVEYFRTLKRSHASVSELRPGAQGLPRTLDIQIPISNFQTTNRPLPSASSSPLHLAAHLERYIPSWNCDSTGCSLPVTLFPDNFPWNLSGGRHILGNRTQPDVENIINFESSCPHSHIFWCTQCKSKDVLNNKSGVATTTKASLPEIRRLHKQANALKLLPKRVPGSVAIFDFFTTKVMRKPRDPYLNENLVITTRAELPQVLGPVFAQRLVHFDSLHSHLSRGGDDDDDENDDDGSDDSQ